MNHLTKTSFSEKLAVRYVRQWLPRPGNTAFDACGLALRDLRLLVQLENFTRLLEKTYKAGVLPRVKFDGGPATIAASVKGFCGQILEPRSHHPWKPALRRRCLDTRVSVAASLFLFRKVIPLGEEPDLAAYLRRMCEPQQRPPLDFILHCQFWTGMIFPRGWDRDWVRTVEGFVLPTSACLEVDRASGGARYAALNGNYSDARYEFGNFLCNGGRFDVDHTVRLAAVETDKWRIVSKQSVTRGCLRPLHNLIYNHLSKERWLLRGEAEPGRFEGFCKTDDEVLVSGDYESATDNLNLHVSKAVLAAIRARSTHIPSELWDEAEKSLVSELVASGSRGTQARGQLMGNYLSFPLLCLINYLTFTFAVERARGNESFPVRINGDDIVFRSSLAEYRRWAEVVNVSGLKLSKGKTLLSTNIFSLNSSFFRARHDAVSQCSFIRAKCLYPAGRVPQSVRGRLENCAVGLTPKRKGVVQARVLSILRGLVYRSQRSVGRGLGASVGIGVLAAAGMADRERFYATVDKEPPLPVYHSGYHQDVIPGGWRRVEAVGLLHGLKCDFDILTQEMLELCWTKEFTYKPLSDDEQWERIREGTYREVQFDLTKMSRLLRTGGSTFNSFVRRRAANYRGIPGPRRDLVWVRWIKEGVPGDGPCVGEGDGPLGLDLDPIEAALQERL